MRLAIVAFCAAAGTAIADPHVDRTVDVEQMARRDCARAREAYLRAAARCADWSCGEYVSIPDVCRREARKFLVEILRSAEDVLDMR